MNTFSLQHYIKIGKKLGISEDVLHAATTVAKNIQRNNPEIPIIFTLAHLSLLSGTRYSLVRSWIGRRGPEPYREHFLRKSASKPKKSEKVGPKRAWRRISIPTPALMKQQRWIVERILHKIPKHEASVAFHHGSSILEAARLHCGCRWLIKMDIENFFESIYEPKVYKVFASLGFPHLLAFELTRLCTRIMPSDQYGFSFKKSTISRGKRGPDAYNITDQIGTDDNILWEARVPEKENSVLQHRLGSLPQGALTSPLLANLAVTEIDNAIQILASGHNLIYTRYADDIALSTTRTDFCREEARLVIGKVSRILEVEGLSPHRTKTRIIPPGSRKIVLGLVVDGARPRLTREFRNKLRLHAYMLGELGIKPSDHAESLSFRSTLSMRRHIQGKIAYAKHIEPDFAEKISKKLKDVNWLI